MQIRKGNTVSCYLSGQPAQVYIQCSTSKKIYLLLLPKLSLCFLVLRLAARFAPDVDQEALKDEFEDLQLMEDASISFEVDGRPQRLDAIWGGVLSQKTALGVTRFPTLGRVMTALLSLLHSNADCERAFSMVRKVHTECRKSLCADAITAFLQCKINFDINCCEFDVTPAMLRGAKHATAEYNKEHV